MPLTEEELQKQLPNQSVLQNRIEVGHITTKVPPFWKANPTLWFCQLESQFFTKGITAEKTKYHSVVAAIESDVLAQVSDIIISPPTENPYSVLKHRLLDRYADSEEKRLKKLLRDMNLGDKKPSYLLREMKELASTQVSEDVLKTLWLQQLPQQIQAILSVSSEELSTMALLADKISEVSDSSEINSVSSDSNNKIIMLEKQISTLTLKIDQLTKQNFNNKKFRRNSRSRSASSSFRQKSSSRNGRNTSNNICWYHKKFQSKANKCIKPCAFINNSENN